MNTFSKKEALVVGWQRFKERPFFIIGLFIITTLIAIGMDTAVKAMGAGGAKLTLNVLDFALQIIIGMGLIQILLRLHDKADTHYTDFFEPIHMFFKYLLMTILVMIMTIIGFIFFIIPGIIIMIALAFAPYAMIDKDLGPIEALKESMEMTHGHRWNLFIFGIILVLLNIAGAMFMGIGLLITIPVTALAMVHVYRWVNEPEGKESVVISLIMKLVFALIGTLFLVGLIAVPVVMVQQMNNAQVRAVNAMQEINIQNIALYEEIHFSSAGSYTATLTDLGSSIGKNAIIDRQTGKPYDYTVTKARDGFKVCAAIEQTSRALRQYCKTGGVLSPQKTQGAKNTQ